MQLTRDRRMWRWTRWLSLLVVGTLLLEALPAFAAPAYQAPDTPPAGAAPSLQDCSTVSEDTLQGELNSVTQDVFATALAAVDLDAAVTRFWVTLEMDNAVAAAVDRAVARVQAETDLWNQFLSGWSPDMAQQLTLAVATYTFDDPTFRTKMDELSKGVSEYVAGQLGLASANSASAALYCLQTFIGGNYSQALVNAFEERVQVATSSASLLGANELSPDILQMVGEHQMALGGIGVIIVAQITRKIVTSIAEKISQRVAGKIVGRLLGQGRLDRHPDRRLADRHRHDRLRPVDKPRGRAAADSHLPQVAGDSRRRPV